MENKAAVNVPDFDNGLWMYAINAGKADAILVGNGRKNVCLIDTGYGRTKGKICCILKQVGINRLDAVFITHTDDDHTQGLEWITKSNIEVGKWYASNMFLGIKKNFHPALKAAKSRGQTVKWLKAGDTVKIGDMRFDVIGPITINNIKDDNNSLVMMLKSKDGKILLGGDMEFPEERQILKSGADIKCDVFKIGNHADNDTLDKKFAIKASPKLAVISTSSIEKPDTPSEHVMEVLWGIKAKIAVTEEATGGIFVKLTDGNAMMERAELPIPTSNVYIKKVSRNKNRIVLCNDSAIPQDLTGFYLTSDNNSIFYFPDNVFIAPNERLIVGTKACKKKFDIQWTEKNIINKIKKDVITLYDNNGMKVHEKTSWEQ